MTAVAVVSGEAEALHYARATRERAVDELRAFVRLPSVSSGRDAVARCGAWLADHLHRIGLPDAVLVETGGNPVVVATWRLAPGRPTLLVYGHYDVQPAEPLSAWSSPPFDAALRGGCIFGRGASDDKGQLFAHVKAIEAWLAAGGWLPCNVICLFEGEEELGSPHLPAFLRANRSRLAADAAVVSDMSMRAPDHPALTYSLRGVASFELEVRSAPADLHSGVFGGAVANAATELSRIVASLQDRQGRVTIPGFYDDVRVPAARERSLMAAQGPADSEVLGAAGVARGWGEPGYTVYERTTIRPSLSVNGLSAGYEGRGGKAVIPAHATAKLSLRLVPGQRPDRVERLVREHVARVASPAVEVKVTAAPGAQPVEVPRGHPAMVAAASACRRVFGHPPALLRSGGSIEVIDELQRILALPVVALGFGLRDDRWHAPNERFPVRRFGRAIDTSIAFLREFGERVSSGTARRPSSGPCGGALPGARP